MLLQELFAKDIDLSEYDKKLMVNIKLADEDGLNVKSLYAREDNPSNLRASKEDLLKYKFIEETDRNDFYIITSTGIEAMNRAALIDDSEELIDANASEYYYDDETGDSGLEEPGFDDQMSSGL